jgi:adenosine deaminase
MSLQSFIERLPKVELHMHVEGSLEPELMFEIARRNGVPLRYGSVGDLRRAYAFKDLQSFLDIYYEGAQVLLKEPDFHDMAMAYFKKAAEQRVRHAEIFFDPQTHTERGVPIAVVIEGLASAQREAERDLGVSSRAHPLCFLRHLSADACHADAARGAAASRSVSSPWGLDSSEVGHPPSKFRAVFDRAREEGLLTVAHAGEEGPPQYIWEALDMLGVSRIDHGVRCVEDAALVEHLRERRIPLTVCPLSNVKLRVFDRMEDHNLGRLLELGLCATVNSDDPAYFGGYVQENYLAVARGLGLGEQQIAQLARNAIDASFIDAAAKRSLHSELAACVQNTRPDSRVRNERAVPRCRSTTCSCASDTGELSRRSLIRPPRRSVMARA